MKILYIERYGSDQMYFGVCSLDLDGAWRMGWDEDTRPRFNYALDLL